MSITTIDCQYTGHPGIAAAYLVREGDEAAFVETNTAPSVPRLIAALEAEGMTVDQVRYIVITHIHLDHAGGAGVLMGLCPNATLLAHPKAAPHAVDPSRIIKGATAVYGESAFAELYGTIEPVAAERVRIMGDGEVLTWGDRRWTFLHTRGHANHHFVVHDSVSNGVFTGDSFGILYPSTQRNGPFVFPSTSPTDFDAAAAHASVDRIVGTGAERVFPTHFGEHGNLEVLAGQMHALIEAHGRIVDEADDGGLEGDALDAFCRDRVRAVFDGLLKEHGLDGFEDVQAAVALDIDLNGQGVAFAVKKRRFKRQKDSS